MHQDGRTAGLAKVLGRIGRASIVALAAAFALPGIALAHGDARLTPGDLPARWALDAQVVVPLAALAAAYAIGVRALWSRAGRGRGVAVWRAASFACGVFVLFVALISPLDAAADAVFSAHMLQHALLTLVAPPLLVLGAPAVALAWCLPAGAHRALRRAQRLRTVRIASSFALTPAVVWSLQAVLFSAWHIPRLYDAAVHHDILHGVEHLSLLGAACLFWWLALHRAGRRGFPYGVAMLFVFTAMLQMMIVPALLTFAATPWYPHYAGIDPAWRLSPLQDQLLGGLIMWMLSNVAYLLLAAYLVVRWLQQDEAAADATAARVLAERRHRANIPQRP